MKKVMKYPIYPIAFSYVSGIFCGFYFKPSLFWPIFIGVLCISVFLFCTYNNSKNKISSIFKTINYLSLIGVFIAFGSLNFNLQNKTPRTNLSLQNSFNIRITEVLKPNKYSNRYYGETINSTKNEVLLALSKTATSHKPGDVLIVFGTAKPIPSSKNVHDFSYKNYLANKHIYYQITSYVEAIKVGEDPSILNRITAFRDYLVQQFTRLNYDPKTMGFIEALLFGVKNNLDRTLQQQFKDFGIMHVLAVSGMHVLLIFKTLSYILERLRIPRRVITPLLIIVLIVFTLMAGFSGSVIRAVLMCFMLILAQYFHKRTATINLLIGSMFLILLVNPNYLFDIGFQLSYLAVFSISYCYPIVQKYFSSKNWLLNGFGQMVGVSVIAQLGVLPLSIYYFKQVPLLFLLGNIIAIPLTSILLIAWFLQLFLSFIWFDGAKLLTYILQPIANLTFESIHYFNGLFPIKTFSIHWNAAQAILVLIIVFSTFWFCYKKNISQLYLVIFACLAFQLTTILSLFNSFNIQRLVVMSDSNDLVIMNHQSNKIQKIGISKDYLNLNITNYLLHENARIVQEDSLCNAFNLNGDKWLLIDSTGVYSKSHFDYIVLHDHAKVNMERLVNITKPKCIVLHNTMPEYLVKIYATYLEKRKIPYYNMRNKGAYVLNYNSDNN